VLNLLGYRLVGLEREGGVVSLRYIVLHLGAHKTGTSLVQKYMRSRSNLCVANKIHALRRGDGNKYIGWSQPEQLEKGREELLGEIRHAAAQGANYYVISHENAIGRPFVTGSKDLYANRERALALKTELAGNDFRVVYYIRSQADFLESYYLQTVHEGSTKDFNRWRRKSEPPSLSWRPVYKTLCDVFGEKNVVLRSFEKDIAQGQASYLRNFFASFMPVNSASWENFKYRKVHNPSVGDKGLAMALAINGFRETSEERKAIRKFLQKHFSNRNYPRPVLLTDSEKLELRNRYDAENDALIAESAARVSVPVADPALAVRHRSFRQFFRNTPIGRNVARVIKNWR
jgi:hypothetical protein